VVVLAVTFALCLAGVAWVYALYPLTMALVGRLAPRPRARAPLALPLSVVVAAHDEQEMIATKVANVYASDYPRELIQVVVVSDGSTDRTVELARGAGAGVVLDLPRVGKLNALNRAVEEATGDLLVFTDADSLLERDTLSQLVANFADDHVGGVSGNEVSKARGDDRAVARGEGLYWRYEQWIKRLEDRAGCVVSATGRLYAIRRGLFRPSTVTAGTDDFVISTGVVRAGYRLAFDPHARVVVDVPSEAGSEMRRRIRVTNRALRAAFSLGPMLLPFRGGLYAVQVLSHKVFRRFVPFLLVAMLVTSTALAIGNPLWWIAVAPQLALYALALAGWAGRKRRWGRAKPLYVPYFFCLGNVAAGLAVLTLLRGVRFERWEPGQEGRLGRRMPTA
jgi:cellulose synthase/poly-beta-1,6-N-acetylglucosamine synthase-like glycosyltransferase